ncbi:hypothetical protein [Yoonia sp. BS5-3]|uniref:Uncharacterized protein n=1 Tax=Yoonia phaeophyticola TaxID=3137369 RepID=A0ABZ2V1M2_9RHOB
MPLQNRVLPTGEIVADPARGTLTGNRGIIHRPNRTLGTSRWSHHAWICCVLDWQGRKRPVMTGRKWTELFFLDEAVAFAAGHRPCGYCRRAAYQQFVTAWTKAAGDRPSAKEMDKVLHCARIIPRSRTQQTYQAPLADLPSGATVLHDNQPHVLGEGRMHPYQPTGYLPAIDRPTTGHTTVLTPRPIVAVLRAGYRPALHPSATL